MNRNRLLAATAVLAVCLAGQAGAAIAADEPTPTPSAEQGVAANQPPVATDDTATVQAGRTVVVDVLANDSDAESDPLTLTGVTDPSGRASVVAGKVSFATRTTASSPATFTYTVDDGHAHPATGTVTVTITAPPEVRSVSLGATHPFVALHRYSLRGTVSPRSPGPATVVVQRRVDGRWQKFKTDKVGALGRYVVTFSSNRPKTYRFRAVATWTNGAKATSGTLSRTVVARPEVHVSGPLSRRSVPWSYRSGCPVGPSGLRRITINRFTYRHVVARGSLVVRAGAVPDLLQVFNASFASRFPVRSMRPTDAFYAHGRRTPTQSDIAAMQADNTSAFNCRPVTGNPFRVSQHSYGNAIDINTVRNPYVVGSRVYPSWARTYLNRSNVRTGMITRHGVIATEMRQNGWPWGARWAHPDYQHFSSNGG